MSLVILDSSVVPKPLGWAYYVAATNYTVHTPIYSQIYPMVVAHCQANGMNPPSQQEVIDQMCQNLFIPCNESTGGGPITNKWSLNLPVPQLKGCCG